MFLLYYDAKTKKVSALNGSGRAPASLTIEGLRKKGIKGPTIPMNNINAVTVPGAASGWINTVKHFGSGKLSMEQILAPAIQIAEEGFPVGELTSLMWQASETALKKASPNGHELLRNGKAPLTGEIFKNPTLAETFWTLAREGEKGFYEGRIAQEMVNLIQNLGGEMTMEDLKSHKTDLVDPITVNYQGLDVWECPPNGQGIVALMALGIISSLQESKRIPPMNEMEHNSAEYLHIIIEALRLAFSDALHHVGDFSSSTDSKHLLSPAYLSERAKLIDPRKQLPKVHRGEPLMHSDTVYFSVTDKDGNAASFINSVFGGFGVGAVPKGCGFPLQNRGGGFSLMEGHMNCLKGGKRPYHTIIPAMVWISCERGGLNVGYQGWRLVGLLRCYGRVHATSRSDLPLSPSHHPSFWDSAIDVPVGHVQVLLNMLAFGQSPQQALDAPRMAISPHDAHRHDAVVHLEYGVSAETVQGLKKLGHNVAVESGIARGGYFGRGQIIRARKMDDDEGEGWVYSAGSDMRGDGAAIPFSG
jgi:gamma-glutamyltranspeptidase / glutathione hydrolase